jgi:hypothetical protein
MGDLFQNPNDEIEVEPADLGPVFTSVLTITLAKKLASQYEKPWTEELESRPSKLVPYTQLVFTVFWISLLPLFLFKNSCRFLRTV